MREFKIEEHGDGVRVHDGGNPFYVAGLCGLTPGNMMIEMTAAEWRELNGPDEPLPVTPVAKHSRQRCEKCGIPLPDGFVGIYGPCCQKTDPVAAKARVLKRCPSASVKGDITGQWIEDHHGRIHNTHRLHAHEDALWIAADKATAHLPDAVVKQLWEVARDEVLKVWPHAAVGESWHGEMGRGFFIGYGNKVLSGTFIRGEFPEHEAWLDAAARLKTPQKPEWEIARDAVLAVWPEAELYWTYSRTKQGNRCAVIQQPDGELLGEFFGDAESAWLDAASRLKQPSPVEPNGDYIPVEVARPHVNIGCGVYWFDPLRCMNVFANEPVERTTPVYEIDGHGRISREVR